MVVLPAVHVRRATRQQVVCVTTANVVLFQHVEIHRVDVALVASVAPTASAVASVSANQDSVAAMRRDASAKRIITLSHSNNIIL